MKRLILTLISVLLLSSLCGLAQTTDRAVLRPSLRRNWYVQTGIDISLQKPYSRTPDWTRPWADGSLPR